MKPQQIDQKVVDTLIRSAQIIIEFNKSALGVVNPDKMAEIAKLIQEEEHHQEQMELIDRLEK